MRFRFIAPVLLIAMPTASGCGGGENPEPCDPARAVSLQVSYGTDSESVDLGALSGTRDGDLCLVPLLDVVGSVSLGFDPAASYYDLVGADGFRPTQVECVTLDATTFASGWVDRVTGTLVWDAALGLRGCYSVSGAAGIAVYDEPWPDPQP
jgi:hypothetical protein